jgi:3-phosphoshikimate 1-carboxyvinyltransferase
MDHKTTDAKTTEHKPVPLVARKAGPLKGTVRVPGDKSISHRAIMFGGIASGDTTVHGLLEGEDVYRTIVALRQLGATIHRDGEAWRVRGTGVGRLTEPEAPLDMGNSGTSARLLIGLLGTQPFTSVLTGDASLRRRPMERVITPLERMGATFMTRAGGRLPLAVRGAETPLSLQYRLPVASAQVKSAVLLAGLGASGITSVIEPVRTRDHTERLLRAFGASVTVETDETDGADVISVGGLPSLKGIKIVVPGDISSAAFLVVAALLCPDSDLTLQGVGLNPRRTGLVTTLLEMGASIALQNQREEGGEPVADLHVTSSLLKGVTVPPDRAPSMIDEYPVLAMAAACALGTTRMRGLGELRVKESDRLTLVAEGLKACGVNVRVEKDDLIVEGQGGGVKGGATIPTHLDHRIAMSFLILGLVADEPIRIDDGRMIATSFPGFVDLMTGLGAPIAKEEG